jgi:membrane protease YdiL (CAAX protease family)
MTAILVRVLASAVPIIAILVGAAFFTPPGISHSARQAALAAIGIGGILVAERLLFAPDWRSAIKGIGFVPPRGRAVFVALLVSLPMWLYLPALGWLSCEAVTVNPGWPAALLAVILLNGIAEEAIHRGFIFGHLRRITSFGMAASTSAAVFALQHLYLVFTIGIEAGLGSVLLALLLGFPLAFLYERGGNSIGAPAILHTSTNAPMMIFVAAANSGAVILPYMAVVLVSIYLSFAFTRWLGGAPRRPQGTV